MSVTLKKLNADEELRMQIEARERYEMDLRSERASGFTEGETARYKQDILILAGNLNISKEEAARLLRA